MNEMMYPAPFNTGDPRKDLNLTALRYSGSAWWLVLGMIVVQEAVSYANSTEAAHLIKKPIKAAAGVAMASSGQFLLKYSWVLGPAVLAAARLLKRRDTNGCESKLDQQGRREIHDIGNQINGGVTEDGRTVVEVKASQLLALAELIRTELKNTDFPNSLNDSLSSEAIKRLLAERDLEHDISFSVIMDIDAGLKTETVRASNDMTVLRTRLAELLKNGETNEAVAFGFSMLQYIANEGQAYENLADPADYIASLSRNGAELSLEKPESEAAEPLTDSFLANLDRVRCITDDLELLAEAIRDPDVLFAIERGFIRDEIKLRSILQGRSRVEIKTSGRGL